MDATNIEFFASCLTGFEQTLAGELKRLRIRHVRPLRGGVAFFGRPIDAERVCLWSRVASRVTAVVGRVNAGDAELMYAGVYDLPWRTSSRRARRSRFARTARTRSCATPSSRL